MADDPYLRVYRRNVDDPRFEQVYADDRNLATWLRLSMDADAAWPASAPLPYGVKKATVVLLEESGLIVRQPGNRYRVPDIDAERDKRRQSARNAAASRWSDANASPAHVQPQSDGNADAMPTKPEENRTTQNKEEEKEVPQSQESNRKPGDPSKEPRLTKKQLAAWEAFDGPEWQPFKRAWLESGFRLPPTGEQDEQGSQRNVLWPIVEARPNEAAAWVQEARGKASFETVAHVLERWDALQGLNGTTT